MSMVTDQTPRNVDEYVLQLCKSAPETALQIALAESARVQAQAAKAQEEYRALAEVEFDNNGMITKANMAGLWRLATCYSRSEIVPERYRKSPDDCFIALQMAQRLRVDTFNFMQNSYVVKGKPGIEAKLAMAILNASGRIKGRISWKHTGQAATRACTASVVDAATGETLSQEVTWQMAADEGWTKRDGSKWLTMPTMMFQYRSASFLIRMYYPEVLMGMSFRDELEDVIDVESTEPKAVSSHRPSKSLDSLLQHDEPKRSVADEVKAMDAEIEVAVNQDAEPATLEAKLQSEFDALTTDRQRRKWYDEHCGDAATCDIETQNAAANIYDAYTTAKK